MAGPLEVDGRRQRSSRTRARIIDAAARLFVDHGYLATTIESVAQRAGVAEQTVYYAFGTKQHLLSAVLDASIAGDVDPVPVVERPWVEALGEAEDPAAAIEQLVAAAVEIVSRAAPIYEVVRGAASDREVGALLDENRRRRRDDQRRLMELLARSGHLAVDIGSAADIFYALINEEVFQLLTVDCGWDVERFRQWATTVLRQQLTTST